MGCIRQAGFKVDMSIMSNGGCASQSALNISQLPGITLCPRSSISRGRAGISADQMRAANETRRKTTSRETVESRVASPDKDAIVRACPLDDPLDNRKKNQASG